MRNYLCLFQIKFSTFTEDLVNTLQSKGNACRFVHIAHGFTKPTMY